MGAFDAAYDVIGNNVRLCPRVQLELDHFAVDFGHLHPEFPFLMSAVLVESKRLKVYSVLKRFHCVVLAVSAAAMRTLFSRTTSTGKVIGFAALHANLSHGRALIRCPVLATASLTSRVPSAA